MWLDLCFKWLLWYYVKNRIWGQGQVWAVERSMSRSKETKQRLLSWFGWAMVAAGSAVLGVPRVCAKAKPSRYSLVSWRQSSFRGHTDLGYTLSEPFICDLKTGIKTPDSEATVGNKSDEKHPAESPTSLTLNTGHSWSGTPKSKKD